MAPEPAPVCGVGAAFHRFSVRPGHVGSHPFLLTDNDVDLYGFTYTYATLILCGLFRVMAVWWTKTSSRVSALLLTSYLFSTLNHLTVPSTRPFLSPPTLTKLSCTLLRCFVALL